jgi:TetR/AcrR family transcriptional regulator, fatty acid metabolism regulator protein
MGARYDMTHCDEKVKSEVTYRVDKKYPLGRTKIADALRLLLQKKEFNAITTAEIARQAGVTEALIYKYFRDKRDLLHQVLSEYLEEFVFQMKTDLTSTKGAKARIEKLMKLHLEVYTRNRVFAKILVLEVRNFPGYYGSKTYQQIREYSKLLLDMINEGINTGELRDDISPKSTRQVILGALEHLMLPAVIFDFVVDPDVLHESLAKIIFQGIEKVKTK